MPDRSDWWKILVALWMTYFLARVLQIFPLKVPTLLIVVLHVLPPAAFAILHGRRLYGTRGILVFTAFCLGAGVLFESLSLRTGFPFGRYYFTSVMGLRVFQLPILLALAWLGIGYLSWVLASLILGAQPLSRTAVLVQPLVAAFLMTTWDLAMDPVWCNVDRAWVWTRGGPWFGVPLSNFFGWYLTTWLFSQAFALWLRRREPWPVPPRWQTLAVLMYATAALGNLLLAFPSAVPSVVPATIIDAAGRRWPTSDAVQACFLVSLLVMTPLAVLAWSRIPRSSGCIPSTRVRSARLSDQTGV